jgi:phosphatidylglycerophosphatase C
MDQANRSSKTDSGIKGIAVFDFDHTLIVGDSMIPFLAYVAGWPRGLLALAEAVFLFVVRYIKNPRDPALADRRTFLKAHLLQRLLAGRKLDTLAPAIAKLRDWQKWNAHVKRALLDHAAHGRCIVIASGGLDLYLPELLKELPAHTLICTQVEVKDGVIAGAMPVGNCVRLRKAELVGEYLAQNGPFVESWGYGNFPHDVPMLDLVEHRVIV